MRLTGVCLLLLIGAAMVTARSYKVTATRLNEGKPLLNHAQGKSLFDYNYNPAVLQWPTLETSLLVRVQNNNSRVTGNPYSVTPSCLAMSQLISFDASGKNFQVKSISQSSVVFGPDVPSENYGTEDPRVASAPWDGTFYMTYSAVEQPSGGGDLICKLSLASTKNPFDAKSWTRHGPLFPESNWTKSGSLLIGETASGPHYLFYGDSGRVPGLQVAKSSDMIHWTNEPGVWLPMRADKFDSLMVEGGPPPLRLSDGNFLYIYNSARGGFPSRKPDYDLQYNVGWLILDGRDPTRILQRCEDPILSPELWWEIGGDFLTPNVVFLEGLVPYPASTVPKYDVFLGFYGAADQVVGVVRLDVEISS